MGEYHQEVLGLAQPLAVGLCSFPRFFRVKGGFGPPAPYKDFTKLTLDMTDTACTMGGVRDRLNPVSHRVVIKIYRATDVSCDTL